MRLLVKIWKCGQAPVCPDVTNTAQFYCDTVSANKASAVVCDTGVSRRACGTAVSTTRPATNAFYLQLYSNIRKTIPRGFELYTRISGYRNYLYCFTIMCLSSTYPGANTIMQQWAKCTFWPCWVRVTVG